MEVQRELIGRGSSIPRFLSLESDCHESGRCAVESTIFVMNTYVNVAFLRLLLSAEQLAKSDQHLEEELMFCAQANPLSQ